MRRTSWLWLGALLLVFPALAGTDPAELEKRLAGAAGAERVELLLELSEANAYRAPDKVVGYAQQAYDAAVTLGATREQARALLLRGTGCFQLGDLDRAMDSYRQGMKLAEGSPEDLTIGGCLNGIAAVEMKRGRMDAALESFTQAVGHLEKAGNKERLAGVNNNISLIYYAKGKYDQALDFMFKALHLYEEIGNETGQGVVLNAIGNVYNKLDDPASAQANFERALAIAEKANHKQLMVGCLVNLAEIHSKKHEWDQAFRKLTRALAIARELGSLDYISVCLNNLGDVLREKQQPDEALRFYLESLKIFEQMNARPRLAVSYVNIGKLYVKTGRLSDGEAYLLKGFELAKEVEERSLQKDAAEALYHLYEGKGDFRRAFEFQRAYGEIEQQLFSRENYEKLTTLQARYESEKQAREIELLRKEGEIQVLKVKRQRLWIVFIATGLIMLAALAVALYRRYRLKVRSNAELGAAYARMAELAKYDEVTRLYNRRSAMQRIELEMVRTSRSHRPFGIVMIDVDDFKAINDVRGHACGDAVLRSLADTLRANVRTLDLVARWGGEEFLVVLPETSREGAALVAEKLRQTIAATPVSHDGVDVRCTCTLGVDAYDRLGSVSECIRRADEALYEGKRAGKNRVVCATV